MTSYMLDTDICIYIIKKHPPSVLKKLESYLPEQIFISSITWSELVYGAEKSQHKEKNQKALKDFIQPLTISPFELSAANAFGKIRAQLENKGKMIGIFDMMIAAHAKSLDVKLVTNNEREFLRVPDLRIENWAK